MTIEIISNLKLRFFAYYCHFMIVFLCILAVNDENHKKSSKKICWSSSARMKRMKDSPRWNVNAHQKMKLKPGKVQFLLWLNLISSSSCFHQCWLISTPVSWKPNWLLRAYLIRLRSQAELRKLKTFKFRLRKIKEKNLEKGE